jgi:hypothetical protein
LNVLKKALSHIMKKIILSLLVLISGACYAQSPAKLGPTEQKLNDAICDCMTKQDLSKVITRDAAANVFSDCIMQSPQLVKQLAAERKVKLDDAQAMNAIGVEVGKSLMTQGCQAATQLAIRMSGAADISIGANEGVFKRIDAKGFAYLVIMDADQSEKSFVWLHPFDGSEKLIQSPSSFTGKKLTVRWKEVEVYIPELKAYQKVKEIIEVETL